MLHDGHRIQAIKVRGVTDHQPLPLYPPIWPNVARPVRYVSCQNSHIDRASRRPLGGWVTHSRRDGQGFLCQSYPISLRRSACAFASKSWQLAGGCAHPSHVIARPKRKTPRAWGRAGRVVPRINAEVPEVEPSGNIALNFSGGSLLSPLRAGAAHASSYLALAIAVAGWNILGQISLVGHLRSPAAAQGAGVLTALAGDAAQCPAGQR